MNFLTKIRTILNEFHNSILKKIPACTSVERNRLGRGKDNGNLSDGWSVVPLV